MDLEEVDDIFLRANVIVTTMKCEWCICRHPGTDGEPCQQFSLSTSPPCGRRRHGDGFSRAISWRRTFCSLPQTPFEKIGARVDGRPIYAYPAHGNFKPDGILPKGPLPASEWRGHQDDSDQRHYLWRWANATAAMTLRISACRHGAWLSESYVLEALHTAYTASLSAMASPLSSFIAA